MIRSPIRRTALVLLIVMFCLMGHAMTKLAKGQQSHTLMERMKSGTATRITGEQLDVTAQRTGELLQGQTIIALTREGIPESEAKADVPIRSLLNLLDDASYAVRDGQTSVSMQGHDGNITATGKCDSITRQYLFYEHRVFRQRNEVDNLERIISRMEQTSGRNDETYEAKNGAVQSIKGELPATWHKWSSAGFVGGLLPTSPLKKLRNRILTFLK